MLNGSPVPTEVRMNITRRTAFAIAAMAALIIVTGTIAVASTTDLPVLGFGSDARQSRAIEQPPLPDTAPPAAPTTTVKPIVVEQVVYEDVYERAPGTTVRGATAAPTAAPAPATAASPTTTVATTPSTTRAATVTTTTRTAPPAGCRDAEWDKKRQQWKCEDEHEDEHEHGDDD